METPDLCWSEVWVAQDLQVVFEVGTILREWAANLWDLCSFWVVSFSWCRSIRAWFVRYWKTHQRRGL